MKDEAELQFQIDLLESFDADSDEQLNAQMICWLKELQHRRSAMLQGAEPVASTYKLPANTPCKDAPEHIWLQTAGVWPENGELTWCSDNQHEDDTLYVRADVVSGNSPVIPNAYDIEAFGVFRATEGENGLMMDVDHFHFETDSCPQIGKDKFVPKFAIQAIINRLQKDCDNMEAD